MQSRNLSAALLAFFLFFSLTACADPTPAPATNTPTPEPVAEIESEPTTTAVPTITDAPPTDTPTETPASTPEVEATEPATAVPTEPVSYTISVTSPQPNQAITVARDFTFSGSISPVPSQRLELEMVAQGSKSNGETLLSFAEVDPATGNWQVSTPIHPRRTGPATLHVRVAGASVAVPVKLQLAEDEPSTIVTVNQPLSGDIAVAGRGNSVVIPQGQHKVIHPPDILALVPETHRDAGTQNGGDNRRLPAHLDFPGVNKQFG